MSIIYTPRIQSYAHINTTFYIKQLIQEPRKLGRELFPWINKITDGL